MIQKHHFRCLYQYKMLFQSVTVLHRLADHNIHTMCSTAYYM